MRASTGHLIFSIFNVDTLQERPLGAYSNTAYSFSPNREWLLLIDNDSNETLVRYFFDEQAENISLWAIVPDTINERSFVWVYDSNTLSYILPNIEQNQQSAVYILDVESNQPEFLTYIPNNIARAFALDNISIFENLLPK